MKCIISSESISAFFGCVVGLFLFGLSHFVYANEGFTGGVTPSRFELSTTSNTVVRRSMEVYNLGTKPSRYSVRTVDWNYSDEGNISFSEELAENSCRPWVRLEKREIQVLPSAQTPRNFRFEIHVPEDAPKAECRFALMIEGVDSEYVTQLGKHKNIAMPINGRIAVIVYLGVNGVEPDITINKLLVDRKLDSPLPTLEVYNGGDAHGRLESELFARTAEGKKVELSIASSPILAQQTRLLELRPTKASQKLTYPLSIKGKLYSDNNAFSIDTQLN